MACLPFPWQAAFTEAQPEEVLPKPLEVGSLVILQGLKSAPELNEQKGEIETWCVLGPWERARCLAGCDFGLACWSKFVKIEMYS